MAPALLAIAWLMPGAGMLLAGRLLPVPMVIIFVPLALALGYFAMRQLPASWPQFGEPDVNGEPDAVLDASAAAGWRADVPVGALIATVAIAAGFGVWQALLRSEQVFAVGDPSVYLQYGYWIAEHGTARIPTSASAFGTSAGLVFGSPGFYSTGGSLTPSFLPGLPLVLAAGTWLSGLGGALTMPAVIGGCAVLSFGGVVGRLAGPRWAPVGALVLAVSLPELYVSRTPFAEPLVQVLLFGGLCLLIDSFGVLGGGLALAGLGGLALGLTVLVWIGSLSILLPVFPLLALLFAKRRRQAGPFGTGLFLGIGIGLSVGLAVARSYLSTVSSELHVFGLCAAGFGLITALVTPLAFPAARARVRQAFEWRPRMVGLGGEEISLPSLESVLQWLALALPVIALIGLAVRPYLQIVRGQTDPTLIREIAPLQRIAGLPVDGRRQYYEQSFDWVLWYLGVPAVLLACAGAAVLGRRLVRAAFEWRAAVVAARLWALPFLIIVWSVATVLWDPAVAPWQPWASHRLVPVVLPGLVLLGVWVSSRLTLRAAVLGASRLTVELVAFCCVLALAIPPLVTSLNPRTGAARVGRALFVRGGQVREPGAAARRGRVGDVRRVGRGGVRAVRRHRASCQCGVRRCLDRGRIRADRARALRYSGCFDGRGFVGRGGRAAGDLDRAGRAAPGAARLVARVGVAVRDRVSPRLVAADIQGRRGADRAAGWGVAGLVRGVDGVAAWIVMPGSGVGASGVGASGVGASGGGPAPGVPPQAPVSDLLLWAGVHRVRTSSRGGAVR